MHPSRRYLEQTDIRSAKKQVVLFSKVQGSSKKKALYEEVRASCEFIRDVQSFELWRIDRSIDRATQRVPCRDVWLQRVTTSNACQQFCRYGASFCREEKPTKRCLVSSIPRKIAVRVWKQNTLFFILFVLLNNVTGYVATHRNLLHHAPFAASVKSSLAIVGSDSCGRQLTD